MSNPPPSDSPRESNQIGVVTAIGVIVAIVGVIVGWLYFAAPSPRRFAVIVDALTNGSMKDAPTGQTSVVKTFPGLTPKNEIFLTRRPDGSFVALFPTYYNKGTDIAGLLYTSRPLRPDDTYTRAGGLNVDKRLIDVANARKLYIDSRIDAHWYRVSYGLE